MYTSSLKRLFGLAATREAVVRGAGGWSVEAVMCQAGAFPFEVYVKYALVL